MSDRTTLCIVVRKEDKEKIRNIIDEEIYFMESDNELVTLWFNDINYGGIDELELLTSQEGINFYGFHGTGYEYPYEVFVCLDGNIIVCNSTDGDNPAIHVYEDGYNKIELKTAEAYWRNLKELNKLWGIKND